MKVRRIYADGKSDLREDDGADFLPLQLSKGLKRKREDQPPSPLASPGPRDTFYGAIEDRTDLTSSDAAFEHITDESSSEEDAARARALIEVLQLKRADLLNRVKQNPTDWHAWVALVELQDEMDDFNESPSQRSHTNAERYSNAEVTMSIYSKALKSVVDPEGRERLHLGMMSKAPIVWDISRLSSHWQGIIKQHPLCLALWKRYLDFYQSTPSGCTFEAKRKRLIEHLDMLQGVRRGATINRSQHSAAHNVQMYIFLRLTILLREGGYAELAVAMWQAFIEFEFNKPLQYRGEQTAKSTYEESVTAFEQYWESEAPRIGEPNARGWLNFNNDKDEHWRSPTAGNTSIQRDTRNLKSWVDAERRACGCSNLPSRTTDEALNDPYAVVLFSDVRCALMDFPAPSDVHVMIGTFLRFCHLPPYSGRANTWYDDQFIRNEILYDTCVSAAFLGKQSSGLADNRHVDTKNSTFRFKESCLSGAFAFPLGRYELSSDTLFSPTSQWFSALGSWTGSVPKDFVLQTLNVLVAQGAGGDELAEYLLALELHLSPSTVKRSAKNLLRQRPTSLRLYNAYALLEEHLCNTDTANKVWDTAIQMSRRLNDLAKRDTILLWRSRAWQHLSLGQTLMALQQISRYGLESGTEGSLDADGKLSDAAANSTLRLRLRNAFSAGRDLMSSMGLPNHAVIYSELLVLSEYLLNNTSIQAALTSFTDNLRFLKGTAPSAPSAEALFRQMFARLLYIHATHKRTVPPATIRSFLAESIAAFPHNTIFLSLYAWNESRFRVDDRVRGIMRDVVFAHNHRRQDDQISDHVTSHFFAVYTDIQRGLVQGSNQSAVRGTFERALSSDGAAHSAGLWKLYLLYEHSIGDLKRMTGILHRAMRACPWAKEIYMLAFDRLSGEMPEAELRGIYELMVEMELRIHVAL
ncbi:MAG: hypothetical protein Q9166_007972 [cf. Caloplaca sp. 2 TL-2023]